MFRNIRFFTVLICCLLIFSPITEIWVKAEEITTTDPSEPGIDSGLEPGSEENTSAEPEVKAGICPEDTTNLPSEQKEGESGTSTDIEQDSGVPTETEVGTQPELDSKTDENCEDENLDSDVKGLIAPSSPFTDVLTSYMFFANINHLYNLKIINGYENPDKTFSFRPEEKVTRAQAAKMIIESIGEKQAVVTKQIFNDIPVNHWGAGYIHRAYELGIFKGYENGKFGPNDTLKRSQMAKVIVEAYNFNYNGYTPSTQVFFDVNSNYWAYDYIEKMHYNGLSNGSNYRFLPEKLISRAQFSAFLSRAIEPKYRLKVTGPITTTAKVISKTALNIRASASATSTILGKLSTGTMVNILGLNGFWAKISHNGISGYVHKSYLKLYSPDPAFPLKGRIIVIDPGHGFDDPGTHYLGYKEKDIVLSVGKKVAEKLRAAGATVVMTRDADTFLELAERVEKAEDVYAELFVSIHVNSLSGNTTVNGTETYYNTSNNMNGAESKLLAYEIQKEIVERADMYNRGIKDSGFYVIKNNQIPAVLVEMGFLPNKDDREKLISDQYQSIFAESIYQGIRNYYLK